MRRGQSMSCGRHRPFEFGAGQRLRRAHLDVLPARRGRPSRIVKALSRSVDAVRRRPPIDPRTVRDDSYVRSMSDSSPHPLAGRPPPNKTKMYPAERALRSSRAGTGDRSRSRTSESSCPSWPPGPASTSGSIPTDSVTRRGNGSGIGSAERSSFAGSVKAVLTPMCWSGLRCLASSKIRRRIPESDAAALVQLILEGSSGFDDPD
jgi:hypothetical protein